AFYAGKSAQLRPTAIAVHDDGDVTGNCFDSGRHLAALYLEFVAERQVAWVANDEIRMTKPEGMTNDQMTKISFSQFVIVSTFDIRASSFREREVDSSFYSNASRRSPRACVQRMIVGPRAGARLTGDDVAPATSEIYLSYLLATNGS